MKGRESAFPTNIPRNFHSQEPLLKSRIESMARSPAEVFVKSLEVLRNTLAAAHWIKDGG